VRTALWTLVAAIGLLAGWQLRAGEPAGGAQYADTIGPVELRGDPHARAGAGPSFHAPAQAAAHRDPHGHSGAPCSLAPLPAALRPGAAITPRRVSPTGSATRRYPSHFLYFPTAPPRLSPATRSA